jgi:L-alanine-DL-glutamate epimerase-like enolase superfamily enzyme
LDPPSGEAFHTYAAWWVDANTVKHYLDDEYKFTLHPKTNISATPFSHPMHVNMVTETYDWQKPPTLEAVTNASINTVRYEWVRAYTLVRNAVPSLAGQRTDEPPAAAPPSPVRDKVLERVRSVTNRIDGVELYAVQVNAERRFSYEVQTGRVHVFIRFMAGGQSGWAEGSFPSGKPGETLDQRIAAINWYRELKGKTPFEVFNYLVEQRSKYSRHELEYAELATLDLAGRLTGKPATELLGLTGTAPVPGLYCILSDDPQTVRKEAARALEQNLCSHLKVKLYGKTEVDQAVVRAAREVYGKDAYVAGDVNMGYRHAATNAPVDDVVAAMIALRNAGLDACEDPAKMSNGQWAQVQERIGKMSLIPDVPLRPAWKSRLNLDPRMGRIYNMHPSCMGSIIEMVELSKVIRANGRKLMVGDSSVVGPGCPAWEQLAIGMGADWVEAVEKPQENDVFQRCTVRNPVHRTPDGKFGIKKFLPGFGVEIDVEKLKLLSCGFLRL